MADIECPPELRFRFQINKQLLASISLNNPTDKRIGFKIKTTAPKKYVVRPSSGVAEPKSSTSVQVIMQAQKEVPPDFQNCKDKFMIQTTVLGETEQVDKETFNKDLRKDLKEHRLKVLLEGPAAPPSPVPEANENDEDSSTRAAAAAVVAAPAAGAAPPETRLRSALDNLSDVSAENKAIKQQLDKVLRERDDLRRQLDMLQLNAPKPGGAATTAVAPKANKYANVITLLLMAIIAFLVGHYFK